MTEKSEIHVGWSLLWHAGLCEINVLYWSIFIAKNAFFDIQNIPGEWILNIYICKILLFIPRRVKVKPEHPLALTGGVRLPEEVAAACLALSLGERDVAPHPRLPDSGVLLIPLRLEEHLPLCSHHLGRKLQQDGEILKKEEPLKRWLLLWTLRVDRSPSPLWARLAEPLLGCVCAACCWPPSSSWRKTKPWEAPEDTWSPPQESHFSTPNAGLQHQRRARVLWLVHALLHLKSSSCWSQQKDAIGGWGWGGVGGRGLDPDRVAS